jgi:hypothetical protein
MSSGLAIYTALHVVISLVGIASGVVVARGLLAAKPLDRWTAVFLATTLATSLTGFGFPFERLLPSHVVGVLSILVLTPAILARYRLHLVGVWRVVYVIGAMVAFYFNVFVLIVQLFLKVPVLKALAPTQTEPPFAVAQLVVLAGFIGLCVAAVKRFHPDVTRPGDRVPVTARRSSAV